MPRPILLLLAATLLLSAAPASAQTPSITASPLPALGQTVPLVKPSPTLKTHRPAPAKPATATSPGHTKSSLGKAAPAKPAHTAKPAARPKPAPVPAPTPAPTPGVQPAAAPPKPDPTKGTTTGLKLPRWVAFRSDEVNVRTGPGVQYPIDWQYHRRDLPVRVLREYEVWRLIELQDGTKGWVHQATLTGRRGFIVLDSERVLRAAPEETGAPVARLEPGVVGHIRTCEAAHAWCEVQTGDYRGWLRRSDMWGVDPDEAVN